MSCLARLRPRGEVLPRTLEDGSFHAVPLAYGVVGLTFVVSLCCGVTQDSVSSALIVLSCVSHNNLALESQVLLRFIDHRATPA